VFLGVSNTTFRKLDLFPSSGEGGEKISARLGPLDGANLNQWTVHVFRPARSQHIAQRIGSSLLREDLPPFLLQFCFNQSHSTSCHPAHAQPTDRYKNTTCIPGVHVGFSPPPSLTSNVVIKIPLYFLLYPLCITCPTRLKLVDLSSLIILGQENKLCGSSLYNFYTKPRI
jgi:hypothetical protein